MRVILFDVDHGFSSFIRTPSGHTLLIDCGKGANFSPAKYLFQHEPCVPLTKLIVTHPHDDHIEDFASVTSTLGPTILLAQNFNWNYVKTGSGTDSHESLDKYVVRKNGTFNGGPVADPNYGMAIQSFWLEPNHAQSISASNNSTVNNSSIVTVASFVGTKYSPKFLFGGDMEQAGWDELLKTNPAFARAVAGTWFYFASHHGHKSGFSTNLFDAMSKPFLNLISVRRNDDSRDDRYSADDFSFGWYVDGKERKMLSTTCDGSIFIDVGADGLPDVNTYFLADNLEPPKSSTIFMPEDIRRRIGF